MITYHQSHRHTVGRGRQWNEMQGWEQGVRSARIVGHAGRRAPLLLALLPPLLVALGLPPRLLRFLRTGNQESSESQFARMPQARAFVLHQ